MSDAKSPSDLSMDEILTTMRRIIADDSNSAPGMPGLKAGGAGSAVTLGAASERADHDGDSTAAEPPGAGGVLELTEALNEDGTVRHLAPIGGGASRRSEELIPEAPKEPLQEAAAEPVAGESGPPALRARQDEAPEPRLPFEPRLPPDPEPDHAAAESQHHLISEASSLGAAAALRDLAAMPREPEMPRTNKAEQQQKPPRLGDRPLDDLVTELLRPLLRNWLDDNLPQLVERLVQREIDRVVARSGRE
jgi:hypothetical protein